MDTSDDLLSRDDLNEIREKGKYDPLQNISRVKYAVRIWSIAQLCKQKIHPFYTDMNLIHHVKNHFELKVTSYLREMKIRNIEQLIEHLQNSDKDEKADRRVSPQETLMNKESLTEKAILKECEESGGWDSENYKELEGKELKETLKRLWVE